ncbi:hypothetical protein IFM89_036633 [Coptis chinensis]|uniref:Phorbol-ester/DAG-type domain-containing protein n=1 Tax=Coptis chinensis TaxID=261450 RepID=A0A835LLH5_9MAGN|nr:hypothetical protein IFM89_036633 [Coptis chinensis]
MLLTNIKNFSHDHNLILEHDKTPYKCDGCKEPGWGPRYRCEECNYDLHMDCALASGSLSHSFYENCTFEFLESAPSRCDRFCDACTRDIQGFVYHCHKTGYDLHPCCANLPYILQGDGLELHLNENISSKCVKCRRTKLWGKIKGWSYRSTDKEYHIHVACVKDMVVENWKKGYFSEVEINNLAMEITAVPNLQITQQSGSSGRACGDAIARGSRHWISFSLLDLGGDFDLDLERFLSEGWLSPPRGAKSWMEPLTHQDRPSTEPDYVLGSAMIPTRAVRMAWALREMLSADFSCFGIWRDSCV